MRQRIRMRCRPGRDRNRSGATAVELAIVLSVLSFVVLFFLDMGLGFLRQRVVAQASRQAARFAIVHGELAPPEMLAWGPTTIDTTAAASGIPIVDALRHGARNELTDPGHLAGLPMAQTTIRVEWIDGNNEIGSRVRVTVTAPFQPILAGRSLPLPQGSTAQFPSTTSYTLTATSTMQIAH